MADRLKVTELDFDDIKTNLKNFLKQQSEFQDYDFEGSGLSVLLDVLAYNTHYNAYYINMIANESFLDTALLRNSVVSHAKKLGYTPRSVSSAMAIIDLIVNSGNSAPGFLTLPKGYIFLSDEVNNRSYSFVTLEDRSVAKSGNNFIFTSVPIYEGTLASYSYVHVQATNPTQTFILPDPNIDTETLTVSVQPSTTNNDITIFNTATDLLTQTSDAEIYFLQEATDGKYQVYFGDDVFGKKLADGSLVTFQYLISSADAPNSANNFVATSAVSGYSNMVVNSKVKSSGGAQRESIEDIKFAAPLQILSQNRAVTKNDYIRLIQQKYPSFEAVNVWGGEENDPPVFGRVFVAAKPRLGFEVTDTVKNFVETEILKPISILTVTPEMVDVDYNFLKVEVDLVYDRNKTTMTESDMKNSLRNLILSFCNNNLNKFDTFFNYSGLESTIQNYNKSIISNEVELLVGKKFRPDLTKSNTYILDFGLPLNKGALTDNFYSTPDFTVVDEEGVSRQCFLEEVPSSFSGLESVIISNGGFNYTTTPTIEIVGDGEGATATATIINGKLARVTVNSPGVGYTTATIRIVGGGGNSASAIAVLEGRYGQIRISYYKIDEVTSEYTKIVLNKNRNSGVAGTIDYVLGKITINDFGPTAINNDFGDITVYMRPSSNIIESKLNKMLVLDSDDATSIVVNTLAVKR
jgi:hypothetical protein